ncbi:unnamed protein product [Ectocarpus sp. CCAP 1310/34]|nr:unnamed protein product [Ectocarpus sp. CCAP 1310/34]
MPQYRYRPFLSIPCLKNLPERSIYLSQPSHVHVPLLLVQRTFRDYMEHGLRIRSRNHI